MRDIEKPSKEDLEVVIQSIASDNLAGWAEDIVAKMVIHIKKNPIQYRNFGPYWWVMKKAFADAGYIMGDIDAEMLDAMSDIDTHFSVFRAMLYYDYSTENDFIGRATHTIMDNGEDVEYTVYDEHMERLIAVTA